MGLSGDALRQRIAFFDRAWGTGEVAKNFAPNKARDQAYFRHLTRWERQGASPAAAIKLIQMNTAINVQHVLPSVQAPTLVMHRVEDTNIAVEEGRRLASRIPDAKFLV